MVRPNVSGTNWGGYDIEKLRIAGLARAIQQRLPYCHPCNPLYCLKDGQTEVCEYIGLSGTTGDLGP